MSSVKIAPEELGKMCEGLSLEETGALCMIALGCLSSENGRVSVPLSAFGVESEKAWQVVSCLALKNRARVAVRWGGSEFYVGTEDMSWQLAQPKPNTVVMAEVPELTERIKKTARSRAMHLANVRRYRAVTTPLVTHENAVTDPAPSICNANGRAPAQAGAQASARTEVSSLPSIISPLNPPQGGESSFSLSAEGPEIAKNGAAASPAQADSAKKRPARPKKGARVRENSPLMVRIGAWFGRRPSTLWSVDEAERLDAVAPSDDELDLLEDYYRSDDPEIAPYRRRAIETLLNNWTKDCDVARQKLGRMGGSASSSSSSSSSGPSPVGDFTIF